MDGAKWDRTRHMRLTGYGMAASFLCSGMSRLSGFVSRDVIVTWMMGFLAWGGVVVQSSVTMVNENIVVRGEDEGFGIDDESEDGTER